jgi:hypothetical protein
MPQMARPAWGKGYIVSSITFKVLCDSNKVRAALPDWGVSSRGTQSWSKPRGRSAEHARWSERSRTAVRPARAGREPPREAKAYGRYCQNQSKKHVAGQKGTPFSQCVTAMAKLATGKTNSPKTACAPMSKKHVAGEKGTPYSRCVAAGAKLLKDQNQQNP